MVDTFMPISFSHEELFPPQETVSMMETALLSTPASSVYDVKEEREEKKPVKKRKSWGQELPVPKTNLPPRKRAKTEDEKEQRRIERVLRNRQAAQSSRERKRQEVEKLEGEKSAIEAQNDLLKERLMAAEHEKFKLQQQNSQLAAELAALRNGSSSTQPSLASSPDFAADLRKNQKAIKQELEESLFALRTPTSLPADLSFFDDGFASIEQADEPISGFTFDSMVDLGVNGSHEVSGGANNDSTIDNGYELFQEDDTLSVDFSHQTAPASPALQPCLGAPSSGCDGSGNAS
ncbi:MAG: hypothetical protein Q9219_000533 [cf. Caloplaca sp. 3 TL-2023]